MRVTLAAVVTVLLMCPTPASAGVEGYAEAFAEWRIQTATHVPDPYYPSLYDPAEAAHWSRTVIVTCRRLRCRMAVEVWDTRTGEGESARFTMTATRYHHPRVEGGVVKLWKLTSHSSWEAVPLTPIRR